MTEEHDGGLSARLMREAQAEDRLGRVAKGDTAFARIYAFKSGHLDAALALYREDLGVVLNTLQGLRQFDPR